MRTFLGILFLIAAVLGGLYVGLWLCLVGGIVQIVEACKATPVESMGIALGILRVFLTAIAGWLTFFIGIGISKLCLDYTPRSRNRRAW